MMTKRKGVFILLLFCSHFTMAQPMYSPEIRARRETKWMTDSLHITSTQSEKVYRISLSYNQDMDKASLLPGKQKGKEQQKLMSKKDDDLRALLDKVQYRKYSENEKMARQRRKTKYNGTHQPM